jgi:ribosomal protein S27AE
MVLLLDAAIKAPWFDRLLDRTRLGLGDAAMPDRDVKTVRDLIYYQYAKVMARSAFGPDAKRTSYGFIKKSFRDLRESRQRWSDVTREDKQFIQTEKLCVYCGATENLQWEHIVPRSIRVNDRCQSCEKLLGIHNQVWACGKCNLEKCDKGLYTFFRDRLTGDAKYYDRIPALLEKKYLKTVYWCHECAGTMDREDLDGDGSMTVLDIDAVLHQ